MPCKKTKSGKWKWGSKGRAIYRTKAECEKKNRGKKHSKR